MDSYYIDPFNTQFPVIDLGKVKEDDAIEALKSQGEEGDVLMSNSRGEVVAKIENGDCVVT